MTRASTPGSLSTRTATVCCSMAAVTNFGARFAPSPLAGEGWGGGVVQRAPCVDRMGAERYPPPCPPPQGGRGLAELDEASSHQHHALFRDRVARLVGGAEQHLVMRRPGGDHREDVLELIDADIGNYRLVGGKHRGD